VNYEGVTTAVVSVALIQESAPRSNNDETEV